MGQCYAVPIILENPHQQIMENRNCVMCLKNVMSDKIYIKCSKCHIFMHTLCSLEYKSTQPADTLLLCPVCKRKNSLNIYDRDISKCKL